MTGMKYSIVVPCYGSGTWLEELVLRVGEAMAPYGPFELILVNDRSPDDLTWREIQRLSREHAFVRGIDLLYNVGQFRTLLCGLERASGEYVITMDDDLQHPPEELPKLIEAMAANPGTDCIMGRYTDKRHARLRNAGSTMIRVLMNRFYNKPASLVTTSFRIMPASFAKAITLYRIASPQLGPMIVSISKNVMNVPVRHDQRRFGKSGYRFYHCLRESFRSIINSSIVPLRVFTVFGLASSFVAFGIGSFFLVRWACGGIRVPGFTSLILAISFFCGMILAGLGVLGEYTGRIIQELTGMPRFHVREEVGGANE